MLMDSISYLAGSDWYYDIAGSVLSTPSDGDAITRFTATRAMTVKALVANIEVAYVTAPSSSATFKVWKNAANFAGTPAFTFTVSSVGVVAVTQGSDVSLVAGDRLEIEVDAADSMDSFGITLKTVAA